MTIREWYLLLLITLLISTNVFDMIGGYQNLIHSMHSISYHSLLIGCQWIFRTPHCIYVHDLAFISYCRYRYINRLHTLDWYWSIVEYIYLTIINRILSGVSWLCFDSWGQHIGSEVTGRSESNLGRLNNRYGNSLIPPPPPPYPLRGVKVWGKFYWRINAVLRYPYRSKYGILFTRQGRPAGLKHVP